MSEAWPLMLGASGKNRLGGVPDLGESQRLDWLPFDRAAEAIVRLLVTPSDAPLLLDREQADIAVYHILNPDTTVTWNHLRAWMQDLEPETKTYPPMEWLSRLEKGEHNMANHPAKKLIGLWKTAFSGGGGDDGMGGPYVGNIPPRGSAAPVFDTAMTKTALSDAGGGCPLLDQPVTKELFGKLYRWIQDQ